MKILVSCPRGRTFDTFFTEENIALARSMAEVVWNPYGRNMTVDEAAELITDCDVYMTSWGAPPLDEKLLYAARRLSLVAHLGADPSFFIHDSVRDKGIKIISAREYHSVAVAEGIIAYILTALRNISEFSYRLKVKKDWKHSWDTCGTLRGKTVGIINYNDIAAQLVRLLWAFNVDICVYSSKRLPLTDVRRYGISQLPLETVVESADIISVHTPTNGDGYHMIDGDLMTHIRRDAILVNTAVGGVVDQKALAAALSTGRFCAVLDAYEREPPESEDPLFSLPNVIMMPHMAGNVTDLRSVIARDLILESCEYVVFNKPLSHEVDIFDI